MKDVEKSLYGALNGTFQLDLLQNSQRFYYFKENKSG